MTALIPDFTFWQWVLFTIELVIKILALGVVPNNRKPSSAHGWLLLIFFLPVVGVPLYLLMSSNFVSTRRHRIQQEANVMISDRQAELPNHPASVDFPAEVSSILSLNRSLTGFPAVTGHNKGFWTDYDLAIRRMADAVDAAEKYVYVEIYIQAWDETTEIFYRSLERAVQRGVQVRLLYDQIGSLKYPGFLELGKRLTDIGVDWHTMLPLAPWRFRFRRPDLRNHRKILVVDGRVGFIGSLNMIDRSYLVRNHIRAGRQWIDMMVELTGPIVTSLEAVFAVDWYTESGEALDIAAPVDHEPEVLDDVNVVQMLPSGPGYTTEPNLRVFNSIIHHAKDRLVICSPYFIPDEAMMEAVTTACYRGVAVELLVSEQADQFMVHHAQSSYYEQLLEAGVHIWQFPAPYVLHSKFVIADPDETGNHALGAFGSSNLDMRSFGLNYESTLVVAKGNLLDQLHKLGETYKSVSRRITLMEWNQRGFWRRYVDNVMRLTSALQ